MDDFWTENQHFWSFLLIYSLGFSKKAPDEWHWKWVKKDCFLRHEIILDHKMQKYENFAKSDQIFPKFYVMTGTQKEVKFTVFIFRKTMTIPQKLLLGQFRVQNWHVLKFLFHCFVFRDSFSVRTKGSMLLRI